MGTIARALMQGDWKQLDLRPESIPHLLHWDLAYLWVLEKPAGLRPVTWERRVETWKRLLCLLLVGELDAVPRRIEPPMVGFTQEYGIDQLHELRYRGQTVGVSSPVVLVRPLPDSEHQPLPDLPDVHLDRRDELHFFLRLLRGQLSRAASLEGERRIQNAVLEIVEKVRKEWLPTHELPGEEGFESGQLDLRLLRSHSFAARPDATDTVTVFFSRGKRRRIWVPRCMRCQTALTREDRPELAIDVDSAVVSLPCPNGHTNDLKLENLFVWMSDRAGSADVTCWTDRDLAPASEREPYAFPPDVIADGDRAVKFSWSAGDVGGSGSRRFLRLRFPGRTLQLRSIRHDALYRNLLIPGGNPADFKGLPIRSEWRHVWIAGFPRVQAGNIEFHDVRMSGVPFAVNFLFCALGMVLDAELALGAYPRPMYSSWKPYAIFVSGTAAAQYAVQFPGASGAALGVRESRGWPSHVSVESIDGVTGATWDLGRFALPAGASAHTRVCAGVDFGTSNSVLYFQEKDATALPRSDSNASSLNDVRTLVQWIEPAAPSTAAAKTWFLPDEATPNQDPYLFPSALWENHVSGARYIRWGNQSPGRDYEARHGFKWDDGARTNHDQRIDYMRWLMFFALPVMLEKLTRRAAPPGIDVGFAYPLAFNYQQREGHRKLLQAARQWLTKEAELDADVYSVNESLASVRASGAYNPGDLFLVADMGGRTLDLALFRYESDSQRQRSPEALHQIGSLDFGGEAFIAAYSARKAGCREGAAFDAKYWATRDAIADGSAGTAASGDLTTRELLNCFHPIAFEFIRTMLASFKCSPEARAGNGMTVLLVGNGWRLRELLADGRDPVRFSQDYFGRLLRLFDETGVQLGESRIQGIANSKHWVACGALNAAMRDQSRELQEREFPSCLPLGRSLTMAEQRFEWNQLAGESGIEIPDERVIRDHAIEFHFAAGPPSPRPWEREIFGNAVPASARNPRPEMLRNQLLSVIRDNRLAKGPLALMLETHWKERLWCAGE